MRIILKYRRGDRPRGSWRYPLWFLLTAHYAPSEATALNPDWRFERDYPFSFEGYRSLSMGPRSQDPVASGDTIPGLQPLTGDGRLASWDNTMTGIRCNLPPDTGATVPDPKTVYFSHPTVRTRFIELLHMVRDDLILYARKWWDANIPETGDAEPTEQIIVFDETTGIGKQYNLGVASATPGQVESLSRRIRRELDSEAPVEEKII